MKLDNIVWTSVISAVLASIGLVQSISGSDRALPFVISSITFAILSLRE